MDVTDLGFAVLDNKLMARKVGREVVCKVPNIV